jgi:hypothetical protein
VLSNWHIFQRWYPKLSTSTSSIITSRSTSALALLSKVLPISTSEQLACWYIHQATHTEHPFSSSGRLCCTISEFTCFINSYWIRECDITVNLYVF